MERIIIDAGGEVLGRLASYVAKKALEGKEIIVINSEKSIISGNRDKIIERYRKLRSVGGYSQKGPKHSKLPERLMKKAIKGMLPDFRRGQGKVALSRVKCYAGVPKEFENEKTVKLNIPKPRKYIELKEVSNSL